MKNKKLWLLVNYSIRHDFVSKIAYANTYIDISLLTTATPVASLLSLHAIKLEDISRVAS